MKTLKTLAASVLLVSGMTVNSFADSSDFAGPYIGVSASAMGSAIDGKFTDGTSNARENKGTAGAVGAAAGFELGYNWAVTDMVFVSVNAEMNPFDADFKADDAVDADDVTVSMSDMYSYSIEPSFSVTSSSAVYLKAGVSEFSLKASGTGLDATQTFDLQGETFALGTKTITDGGMYFKTEVGLTSYDGFTLVGVGTNDGTAVIADIETAYGKIMVGKKF
jgi:hypothetical protein